MSDKENAKSTAPQRSRVNRGQYEKDQELAANLLATGYSVEEAAFITGVRSSEIRKWYSDRRFEQSIFALKEVMTTGIERNPSAR